MNKSKNSLQTLREFIVIHHFNKGRPVTSTNKARSKSELEAALNFQNIKFFEVCDIAETGDTDESLINK
jgi:hypothetical protein